MDQKLDALISLMKSIKRQDQPTQPSPLTTLIPEPTPASPIQPSYSSPTSSPITSQNSPVRAIYLLPTPSSSSPLPTSLIVAILPQKSPKSSPSTSSSSPSHSSESVKAISKLEIPLAKLPYLKIRKTSHTPNPTSSSKLPQTPPSSLPPAPVPQAPQPSPPVEPTDPQPPPQAKPDPLVVTDASPPECRRFTPKSFIPLVRSIVIIKILTHYKKFKGIVLPPFSIIPPKTSTN